MPFLRKSFLVLKMMLLANYELCLVVFLPGNINHSFPYRQTRTIKIDLLSNKMCSSLNNVIIVMFFRFLFRIDGST